MKCFFKNVFAAFFGFMLGATVLMVCYKHCPAMHQMMGKCCTKCMCADCKCKDCKCAGADCKCTDCKK